MTVGETWEGQPFVMTQDEIIAFAKEFDPQPMHTDPVAAAKGQFGGLIASGWHVASLVMRDYVRTRPYGDTPLLGMSIDQLLWLHPVRPGDTLRVKRQVTSVTPSSTRPDRGRLGTTTEVSNQDGKVVMTFSNVMQMPTRPKPDAAV